MDNLYCITRQKIGRERNRGIMKGEEHCDENTEIVVLGKMDCGEMG